jgi:CHASE3 domain sensor protein
MQPTRSSLELKIGLTIAVAVTAVIALIGVQYRITREEARDAEWVDHTHQVLGSITETLLAAAQSQNISRGYAMTGDPTVLAPRETAISELHKGLAAYPETNGR